MIRKWIALSDERRRFSANFGWLVFDRVIRAVVGLLVGAWVARYLGPGQFGLLAYVLAVAALFQAIANLGADGLVVRDISQRGDVAPDVLGTLLYLRVACGALCWIAIVAIVWLLNPESPQLVVLAAIVGGLPLFQASDTVDLWFQSQMQSRRTVLAKFAALAVSALAKTLLILAEAPLVAFAATFALDAGACALALVVAYRQLPTASAWRFSAARASALLKESWPLLLAGLSIMVYMRMDQIMLRELAGAEQLGLYSAILPLSQVWHILPMAVIMSLLPKFSQLKLDNPQVYERRLQQLFTAAAWMALATIAVTIMAADLVVTMLFGTQYAGASVVLKWYCVTNLFVFLGVIQGMVLVIDKTPRLALLKTLVGVVVSVGANLVLIPRWGAVGAAWSAIASHCCSAVLSNALFAPQTLVMQLRALAPVHEFRQP